MKKILLILLLALSASSFAQQSQPIEKERPVYCDVMAYNFWGVGKVRVIIDLGADRNGTILTEDKKAMKFNSIIDVLNYMSKLGWHVKDSYYLSEEVSKQKVLHYLLEKMITDDEQITEGISVGKPEKWKPGQTGDDMY